MTAAAGEPRRGAAVRAGVDTLVNDLARRARLLELKSRRRATFALAGEYKSVFHGTGIEFDSVREYVWGDDVRAIDWNVTARSGRPFVKRFIESRERAVVLVVDRSASLDFGSGPRTKAGVAAEVAALLVIAAAEGKDAVGLVTFTDRVERSLPPARGVEWPRRVLRALVDPVAGRGTDLDAALDHFDATVVRRSVVFVVSDFVTPIASRRLASLSRRHEVVAIRVSDPRESTLAGDRMLDFADPESGRRFRIDAGSAAERATFERAASVARAQRAAEIASGGAALLDVTTARDPLPALIRFFALRERGLR